MREQTYDAHELADEILHRLRDEAHEVRPFEVGPSYDGLRRHLSGLRSSGAVSEMVLEAAFVRALDSFIGSPDETIEPALPGREAGPVLSGLANVAVDLGVPLPTVRLVRFVDRVGSAPVDGGLVQGDLQSLYRAIGRQPRWASDSAFWERGLESDSFGIRTICAQALAWIDLRGMLDRLPYLDVNAPLVVWTIWKSWPETEMFDRLLRGDARTEGRREYAIEMLRQCGDDDGADELAEFRPKRARSGR